MATTSDLVLFAAALLLTMVVCSAHPGHVHEKFIIHAPVRFETIHHYKIHKVPVYVKKHVHHHKYVDKHTHHTHHFDHLPAVHDDHSLEFSDHKPHFSYGGSSEEYYH